MIGFVVYLTEQYHGKETWKLRVTQQQQTVSVSYTHLTLPTRSLV